MGRRTTTAAAAILVLLSLAGCSEPGPGSDSGPEPPSTTSSSGSGTAGSTATDAGATPTPAQAAPSPRERACYDYGYRAAVSPVPRGQPVPCDRDHTAITFEVGELDTVVDGHLVSVDSDRVQAQVAEECPRAFVRFVGGSVEARRLTMLRPVWFTPTLPESDAGANWYRCDAIAVAADERLASLVGRLQGVLDRPAAAERYAMCGTAEPGTPGFRRVICSSKHAWQALRTVDIPGRAYPGAGKVREAGQQTCQDAASAEADDPLNFRWGYEWPTKRQWESGQRYGICWSPSSG